MSDDFATTTEKGLRIMHHVAQTRSDSEDGSAVIRRGQTQQRGDSKRRERMGARTAKEDRNQPAGPQARTDSMSYANRGSKKNQSLGLSRST
jgi:hypothetical protein